MYSYATTGHSIVVWKCDGYGEKYRPCLVEHKLSVPPRSVPTYAPNADGWILEEETGPHSIKLFCSRSCQLRYHIMFESNIIQLVREHSRLLANGKLEQI